jgi:threonine/homoserine/homoserine lactone efflux protein
MYMLKKFDNDADAPDTESIWTPPLMFRSEIVFYLGVFVGSHAAFTVIDIGLGKPLPLPLLIFTVLMDLGTCFLVLTWFQMDRREPAADDEPSEEEDNEDSYFV